MQCPHVPMLQERNTRRGFLEPDQIAAICAALPEELRPIVKFAYATGWRTASEVLPLEWRNVDWAGRCVRLDAHTTKNGEARSFPFTTDIETILKGQLAEHERLKTAGHDLPVRLPSQRRTDQDFRTAWKNACKAAGCPGKLIHDMRRSAVRTFERAGVPRSVAMSIVGHKTESIYRRYAIVDEAMQREAAARLDAWMQSPSRHGLALSHRSDGQGVDRQPWLAVVRQGSSSACRIVAAALERGSPGASLNSSHLFRVGTGGVTACRTGPRPAWSYARSVRTPPPVRQE